MTKKLVVITGASSGIGKALAFEFSKAGYPLLLLARRVEILRGFNLPQALCEQLDVSDLDSFKQSIKKAESSFGPADCLINNAGVMFLNRFHEQPPDEWEEMLQTNVKGVLNGMRSVLGDMLQRRGGTIINISSIAGRTAFPTMGVYCMTKAAVHLLTESIRKETAQANVRCILISPGYVKTELVEHIPSPEIRQQLYSLEESIGEVLQPKDIAVACLYAYQQPQHVCIREMVICPTRQEP